METIAAISTAPGTGAVALLRVSGEGALEVARRVFVSARAEREGWRPRESYFGRIQDGEVVLDEGLATYFAAPASFTGEAMVEFGCHGGALLSRRILELLVRSGARAAQPGEFTQRAFLNGKLDLTQAEAVMDLIAAQSDRALRAAAEQLEGRLGGAIREVREALLGVLAHVEAYIDFPEEDIEPDTGAALLDRVRCLKEGVGRLLGTARQGRVLREGARTVIYGRPNVGKSSLLNRLLGYERAIVSAIPGTTRDTLEEVVMLRGWPLRLIDTAGVRDVEDPVERAGMERGARERARADVILWVEDGSQPRGEDVLAGTRDVEGGVSVVRLLNKSDLGEHPSWAGQEGLRVSCETGAGFEALEDWLEAELQRSGGGSAEWTVAINARHQECLRRAQERLAAAGEGWSGGAWVELVAEELRGALQAIGEVVGHVETEELLGQIFANFCIGK
jgi:tRNA modification GTPase